MTFTQPLPKYLSPSRLQDFQACPRRFQHTSIERIPQPATYATAKGRFVHYVFEKLYELDSPERNIDRARSFVDEATAVILTDEVREEIGMDDAMLKKMLDESDAIFSTYFTMEDPSEVNHEGVELQLGETVDGVPLFGILDRLDRDRDGNLVIVDYKTGSVPNPNYDTQTFANAELYAALCEAALHERPTKIRLLYVAKGEVRERHVTEVVIRARREAAARAWDAIQRYYQAGDFPAKPSSNTCRFCSYQDRCRASGVNVPSR